MLFKSYLHNLQYSLVILLVLLFTFCTEEKTERAQVLHDKMSIKYAKHFGFIEKNNESLIFVSQNFKDTLFYHLSKPYTRIITLGTIPAYQLTRLYESDKIVGIDDIKYYNNNEIIKQFNTGKLLEICPNMQWNYERIIACKPNIIIAYDQTNDNAKLQQVLSRNNIEFILYYDYLENHPLARAEWIKFLGVLQHKDSLATAIFDSIETQYITLKNKVKTSKKPTVYSEYLYGDVWYVAGKGSYISQLIKDAGGKYIFDFLDYESSQPQSLEFVLKYAQTADYWINLGVFNSLQQIENQNSKYALFKAFQNKKVYNNNKQLNRYQYNDYYESGICNPNLLLLDMIKILHPDIINDTLQYYSLLK